MIALRAKGIDRNTFVNEANQLLRSYYFSPANQEPNSRIKKDFWNNHDIEKLPYYREFVFALYLNNLIKAENPNKSLDNVMHDLFKATRKQQFSASLFKDIVHRYVKNGIEREMLHFIDKGEIISLAGINLPIEKALTGRYHASFNIDGSIKNMLIQEIDMASNAYKAGLRNGQKIVGYDSPKDDGDPDQIITIKTTAGTFKFRPEHHNDQVESYQLQTALTPRKERQFNKFFGIK